MQADKSLTFVIPVHGESGLFLGRCIESLMDNQDYPYKDAVVVYDGDKNQMGSALAQEDFYKDDTRVQFIHIEKGGACAARNAGLELAKGDYVCFFDCDSTLQAGGLRTWINAFEDHPECGFVYNGYRFRMESGYNSGVPAKPFDPWELTCNNYISSMNPIKRDICPKWDITLDCLQDWDFWLRVVRAGHKGHFINDFLVITEPPSENSITGQSHRTWVESVRKVREGNEIPDRRIAVTSMGAPFQSKRRAKFLGADYKDPEMLWLKPHDYEAIVSMGYYVDSSTHPFMIFMDATDTPKERECKKIIHFIGTDVFQLMHRKFTEVKAFRETVKVDKMFSNAPWLKTELDEMGIENELLYCPIDPTPYDITPFPKKFTVAVYRSDSNPMHNDMFMFDVARNCPDIQWRFFGGTKPLNTKGIPRNINFEGTIEEKDIPAFIAETSAIARVTVHDGFPASIAEWVMGGRPFIFNKKEMPFNDFYVDINLSEKNYILCKERLINGVRKLQKNLLKIDSSVWDLHRNHYVDLLSPDKYIKRMNEVIFDEANNKLCHSVL